MNAKYLELWKLVKTYTTNGKSTSVVKDFDLTLCEGEFVSLIGHSGCGKSTVLSMVAGLSRRSGGAIILDNKEVREAGPDRAVVFQSPCLLPWMTALENVMLGVDQVFADVPRARRAAVAKHFLDVVGLGNSMHRSAGQLSQGMQQRVGIARAFALSPKILLLDEPFGMLDSLTRMELQEVLLEVWREKKITALMVTHDVDEALFLSDRVAMMTSGPEAGVGGILPVPFARPRDRRAVLEDSAYYGLREAAIGFLENQTHHPEPEKEAKTSDLTLLRSASSFDEAITV